MPSNFQEKHIQERLDLLKKIENEQKCFIDFLVYEIYFGSVIISVNFISWYRAFEEGILASFVTLFFTVLVMVNKIKNKEEEAKETDKEIKHLKKIIQRKEKEHYLMELKQTRKELEEELEYEKSGVYSFLDADLQKIHNSTINLTNERLKELKQQIAILEKELE